MPSFHVVLEFGVAAVALVWALLAIHVLAIERRRTAARATLAAALTTLRGEDLRHLPIGDCVDRVRPVLDGASRELVMSAAAGVDTPRAVADVLAAYLVERWGIEALERDAGFHRTARDKWRRMAALQILSHLDHSRSLELLARAIDESDADLAGVAFSLLGESRYRLAADILIEALKASRHPASRIAAHLDRSPLHLASRLRPLLSDGDALVRRWAATLLGRYADVPDLERELAAAADDSDPGVRKAAVQSLGQIGDTVAGVIALRLLNDPVPYVRTAAVRAIGKLDRDDLAEYIAALFGDSDWWVRFAAKECLEGMGPDIWPVLVRLLDDPDRFVRNGAAEVFQNLGVLDSFIVMEAATDDPAGRKIDLLRRIVSAGGLRLTDSLFERVGATLAPRLRSLLATIGLQHVSAA